LWTRAIQQRFLPVIEAGTEWTESKLPEHFSNLNA